MLWTARPIPPAVLEIKAHWVKVLKIPSILSDCIVSRKQLNKDKKIIISQFKKNKKINQISIYIYFNKCKGGCLKIASPANTQFHKYRFKI